MSSWVDKQRQEAFLLWSRYLAINLHFQPASSYDYQVYKGGTKVTFESFCKKSPAEIRDFIILNNKLKKLSINAEHFLFSNAKIGNTFIKQLLDKNAVEVWRQWDINFGSKEVMIRQVSTICGYIRQGLPSMTTPTPSDVIVAILYQYLTHQDQQFLDSAAYLLNLAPWSEDSVMNHIDSNAMIQILIPKAKKIASMYKYFGII